MFYDDERDGHFEIRFKERVVEEVGGDYLEPQSIVMQLNCLHKLLRLCHSRRRRWKVIAIRGNHAMPVLCQVWTAEIQPPSWEVIKCFKLRICGFTPELTPLEGPSNSEPKPICIPTLVQRRVSRPSPLTPLTSYSLRKVVKRKAKKITKFQFCFDGCFV